MLIRLKRKYNNKNDRKYNKKYKSVFKKKIKDRNLSQNHK